MKAKTICRHCGRRAPLVRKACKDCEKKLGHFDREARRQEARAMAVLARRGWL